MLKPLHVQWRSLQNLVNRPRDTEENFPTRWKSYSQDDLGSLDAFSEGLGLSRDDVVESEGDLVIREADEGSLDNWINRLSEFRESLHGYTYCPEDGPFELEQKLNVVQKVKPRRLFVCLFVCLFVFSLIFIRCQRWKLVVIISKQSIEALIFKIISLCRICKKNSPALCPSLNKSESCMKVK